MTMWKRIAVAERAVRAIYANAGRANATGRWGSDDSEGIASRRLIVKMHGTDGRAKWA